MLLRGSVSVLQNRVKEDKIEIEKRLFNRWHKMKGRAGQR